MQKRLFLALGLSFLVLFVGQRLITKSPEQNRLSCPLNTTRTAPEALSAVSTVMPAVPTAPVVAETAVLTEYEHTAGSSLLTFVDQRAAVKNVVFKSFHDYAFSLANGFAIGDYAAFERQVVDNNKVVYRYADGKTRISKEFDFSCSAYEIKLKVSIENISGQPVKFSFPLSLGTINPNLQYRGTAVYQDVCVSLPDRIAYPNYKKEATFPSVNFLSLRDQYFCAIIEPAAKNYSANFHKISDKEFGVSLISPEFDIPAGQTVTQEFRVYLGPQDLKVLAAANNPDWQSVVYFGKMNPLAHLLLKTLGFFHAVTSNWGFAIIIVSVMIYIILYPLTLKQLRSMKEMQLIQPKVEELRVKYRDDAMRLQKETMELYKLHKINPLGGCLPMLLQLPVFFSFYMVLSRSIELKGAGFLWIKDLADPDKLFVFPQSIPFVGNELNLLPILMVIASFFQQKLSSSQMSGQSAEQQKIMMFLFPIMFGVFFYHMPSGLVLYWFTNTIMTVIQQSAIMRSK